MPARSTVDSGSDRTRARKFSRSSAKTVSPSTKPARRAQPGQHRLGQHERRPAATATRSTCAVVVPSCSELDQLAEQPRPDQAGQRRQRVQDEHADERPAVPGAAAPGRAPGPGSGSATGSSVAWRSSVVLPAGHGAAVAGVARRAGRGGAAVDDAAVDQEATSSTRSSSSGLAVTTTVVRSPSTACRARCSRSATSSLGVGVDRAGRLDQHQDLAGRRAATRASATRCRCPPEKPRPRLVDRGVEALGQGLEDVLGGGDVDRRQQVGVVAGPAPAGRARRAAPR